MIRSLSVLLVAGLLLGACGSISSATAMSTWVKESNFFSSAKVLLRDAEHSATALKSSTSTANELHTVCGVLLVDTESANASLPSPDGQSNALLSKTYTNLGRAADQCYAAGASTTERTNALATLARGLGFLSEATARVSSARES